MSTLHTVVSKLTVMSLLILLSACGAERQAPEQELRLQQVRDIDRQQLPGAGWALSNSVIQLSFCRDRVNTALLAEREELRRWRLVGETSAFPPGRDEGLQQLADLYMKHNVLLYQLSGNFGSQVYQLAYRPNEPEPNIINAFAKIGRDTSICYSSLDAND
ncbi:hypothetical protein [Pseudidiomarina woesei]|uniref:Lipoprotein n=1 Tax=Pseudidiomarina woesei TaxID=1381080 RepID=A0A0K6GYM9_9GAMM|nr:hypothetical protein [Pseudidiomarina woesei]CUA83665.1 hypothetical protein Ga0061064_0724 [Pseudidiomarina woesei]